MNIQPPKIKLIKLNDNMFNGKHPNNINEGFTREGVMIYPPTIGEAFWLESFHTSVVTKIVSDDTFQTLNSTYRIIKL
jgi:hypothetical protein